MHQTGSKIFVLDSWDSGDTFSYLGGAPRTNTGGWAQLQSHVVEIPKKHDSGRKCNFNHVALKLRSATSIGPWSTPKVWKCVYGVSGVQKKCFGGHLMHLNIILSTLNFGRKIKIFGFFSRKRLKNRPNCTFQAQKKMQKCISSAKNCIFKN